MKVSEKIKELEEIKEQLMVFIMVGNYELADKAMAKHKELFEEIQKTICANYKLF